MGKAPFLIHFAVWLVSFAPYFTGCFYASDRDRASTNKTRLMCFALIFPASFCFVSYHASLHVSYGSLIYLALNFAFPFLGCALMSACRGGGFFKLLYRTFPGIIFSVSVGITLMSYLCYIRPGSDEAKLLALLISAPVTALLCFLYLKAMRRYVDVLLESCDAKTTAAFCVYPALFLLLEILVYAVSQKGRSSYLQMPGYFLCALASCFIYYLNSVIADARRSGLDDAHQRALLERALSLQQKQYALLSDRVEQARKARHDIRFHLRAIERYAISGDTDGLLEYISALGTRAGVDDALSGICENHVIEAVAGFYIAPARELNAHLDISINISDGIAYPIADLCVIWGNLMENAIEAIRETPQPDRTLRIRTDETEHTLTILIGNSYSGKRVPVNGIYPSTKHGDGHGIGLESVRALVTANGGSMSIETRNGVFLVSILLFLENASNAAQEAH